MGAITGRLEKCFKVSWFRFHYRVSESRVFALRYHSSSIIVYSLKMASCEPKHVDACVLVIKSCVQQLFISNFFLHIKLNGMNHTALI